MQSPNTRDANNLGAMVSGNVSRDNIAKDEEFALKLQ
jgi:hypothetical protein